LQPERRPAGVEGALSGALEMSVWHPSFPSHPWAEDANVQVHERWFVGGEGVLRGALEASARSGR